MNDQQAIRYTVHARTFGAVRFPEGSPERAKLNEYALSSEYMPSHRYLVIDRDHPRQTQSFRTKREAIAAADRKDPRR